MRIMRAVLGREEVGGQRQTRQVEHQYEMHAMPSFMSCGRRLPRRSVERGG
jgi:hypothetical protein